MKVGNVQIEWKAKKYTDQVKQNLGDAMERSCDYVIKVTKKALSNEGQTKIKEAGINKGDFEKGLKQILGLKEHKVGRTKSIFFGGILEFKDKEGKDQKLDRIYWNEAEDKWVQSSLPGTPPNKQTGNLRESIDKQMSADRMDGRVGPKDQLVYARIHELGGSTKKSTLPKRPYLKPSFEQAMPQIEKIFAYAVAQAGASL